MWSCLKPESIALCESIHRRTRFPKGIMVAFAVVAGHEKIAECKREKYPPFRIGCFLLFYYTLIVFGIANDL